MWYEENDQYIIEDGLGERVWPSTLSLLQVIKQGDDVVTSKGWGRNQFMENYKEGKFKPEKYLRRFEFGRPFGFIMRSLPMVCVDIDGKNGGLSSARALNLPPTLAERSKSGNGYHLFYRVPESSWDEEYGYDEWPDFLGIVPGVDLRATGVIYHYPTQRWNSLPIASLSRGVERLMTARLKSRESYLQRKEEQSKALESMDEMDLILLQSDLLEKLKAPMQPGDRNRRLYSWGCEAYGIVKDWELSLVWRGQQVGLDIDELASIVKNVVKYGNGN